MCRKSGCQPLKLIMIIHLTKNWSRRPIWSIIIELESGVITIKMPSSCTMRRNKYLIEFPCRHFLLTYMNVYLSFFCIFFTRFFLILSYHWSVFGLCRSSVIFIVEQVWLLSCAIRAFSRLLLLKFILMILVFYKAESKR